MDATDLVNAVIEAHGGKKTWEEGREFEAVISASGFLFAAKRRPVLDRVRVVGSCGEPRFAFRDFPSPGLTGELAGDAEARIADAGGNISAARQRPREFFRGMRHLFRWDDLDFIYFGGYAAWNYLATPFLFLREGFSFEVRADPSTQSGDGPVLRVTFPPDLPTHCRVQTFRFGRDFLLRSLEYTAEVVGRWAHALHLCDEYRSFDGIRMPTRRRVYPLLLNRRMPGPLLVDIEVHDFRLVR